MFIFFEELFELGRSQHFFPRLLVHWFQIGSFGVVHRFIVDLGKGIQLFSFFFIESQGFFIFQLAQLTQVDVHGMECINWNAVVGIRVHPCIGNGGVIDGKNLYGLLVGAHCPVYQLLQITEVAYAKTSFAA